MYTKFIIRLIDAIPTPTPEQGDRWVTYTCIFGFGFILGMLVTIQIWKLAGFLNFVNC